MADKKKEDRAWEVPLRKSPLTGDGGGTSLNEDSVSSRMEDQLTHEEHELVSEWYRTNTGANTPDAMKTSWVLPKYVSKYLPKSLVMDGSTAYDKQSRLLVQLPESERKKLMAKANDDRTKVRYKNLLAATDGYGYVDFIMQDIKLDFNEKVSFSEVLGDDFVVFCFGGAPSVAVYSGVLLNSAYYEYELAFLQLYSDVFRGTRLAETGGVARVRFDSYIVSGPILSLSISKTANLQVATPFIFTQAVKKLTLLPETGVSSPTEATKTMETFAMNGQYVLSNVSVQNYPALKSISSTATAQPGGATNQPAEDLKNIKDPGGAFPEHEQDPSNRLPSGTMATKDVDNYEQQSI